jgi:coatomer subunit beta'
VKDNEPISLPTKELGTAEVYPQTLIHSPNGRFAAICGDGEYIIYTALAWRNKAFGQALDFVWAAKENSNDFAIRESATSIKVFKNFQEKKGGLDVPFAADGLTGGVLLGVKGQGGISFFDWQTGGLVRRIEVEPKQVYWSENGELVALACEDTYYVLRFSRENYNEAVQAGQIEEDGVEAAFEVITDISERYQQPLLPIPSCITNLSRSIRSAEWLGDVLIYTNGTNRLNYLVGDQTYTIAHFDKPMYILGYLQRDSRVYLTDKDLGVTSFALSLPVLEYQTLVLRDDMETAAELLPTIPQDQLNKIARFLEGQGHKELALEVATDPEHKFDLALALNQLDIALELARESDADHKWKTLGDAGLAAWDVPLAAECFVKAKDLGSLLLIYSSTSDREGLAKLAEQAEQAGVHNVAFTSKWLLGDVAGCIEILTKTGRLAEAVLFSQTYKPSLTADVVSQWKGSLEKAKKGRVAKSLGVPVEDEELFPEWEQWLKLESEGGTVDAEASSGHESGEAETEEDE